MSFEGIEGSGKSTLLAGVASRLLAAGRECVTVREPGGTPVGDEVRRVFLDARLQMEPLVETLLLNASRAQLVTDVIRPTLSNGRIVLCDRYVDSSIAYQGFGRGLDVELVRAICDAATAKLYPNLTFLVDVSLETSRSRVALRAADSDRIDALDLAFHERVRAGYLQLAAQSPRFSVLDGEREPQHILGAAMERLQVR